MPKVTIKGKKLFYQDVGEGYPILFGHSYLWDSHMWRPQVESLSTRFRCIIPDLWNHGQSEDLPTDAIYSVREMAEDYYRVMQELNINNFAFVGLSVGGMIGVELALKYPKALSALAIIGSYVGVEPKVTKEKYWEMMDQADLHKRFTMELADSIAPLFFSSATTKTDPDLIRSFNIHLRSISSQRIKGLTNIGRGIFSRPNRLADLGKIKIPTLIMVGEDDIPRPPREALQMAELLPNSSLVMFSQAGHVCNLEHPEEITREIEKLVRGIILGEEDLKMVG